MSQFFCKKYFVLRSNSRSNITCFFNTVRLKSTFQNVCVFNLHDSRYFHFLKHNLIPPFCATFFPNSLPLSLYLYIYIHIFPCRNFYLPNVETFTKNTFKVVLNSKHSWNNWVERSRTEIMWKEFHSIFSFSRKNFCFVFCFVPKLTRQQFDKGSFPSLYHRISMDFFFVLLRRLHDLFNNISDNFKSFE